MTQLITLPVPLQKGPGGSEPEQRGPDCLYATELMKLADVRRRPTDRASEQALEHIRGCSYCGPRYDALVRLAETEPASVETPEAPYEPLPPLDTWSGPIAVSGQMQDTEGSGGRVSAITLTPNPNSKLASQPLYLELHWSPSPSGGILCRLVVPASGKGNHPAGVAKDVLDRLNKQWFMVELTTGDPNRIWGFDTILQWDDRETALVSPLRVVRLKDISEFCELVLTHLEVTRNDNLR